MAVIAHPSLTNCQVAEFSPLAGGDGLAKSLGRLIQLWRTRSRERRAFISFDHRDLRDTGLSRWELERELAKPFWKG